jgi:hypothetical protein
MTSRRVLVCVCLLVVSTNGSFADDKGGNKSQKKDPWPQCAIDVHPTLLVADDTGVVPSTVVTVCPKKCSPTYVQSPRLTDVSRIGGIPMGATISLKKAATQPVKECIDYNVSISKLWDTGTFSAVFVNGRQSQPITIVRPLAPFAVGVDSTSTTPHAAAGKLRVVLSNGDAIPYHLRWSLTVEGDRCVPDGTQSTSETQGTPITLPAKSAATVTCTLPERGIKGFVLGGTLKDEAGRGMLTLKSDTPDMPDGIGHVASMESLRQRKDIPLTVSMSYWNEPTQSIANVVTLCLLLVAGGLVSLLMGAAIPTVLRRAKLAFRLRDVKRKSANVLDGLDSTLSMGLDVERRRIQDLAHNDVWFSPDAADNLAAAEAALVNLEERCTYVMQFTPALRLAHSIRGGGLPPTLLQSVEDACTSAGLILRKVTLSDNDRAELATLLATCVPAMALQGQKNAALETTMLAREAVVKAVFVPAHPLSVNPVCQRWLAVLNAVGASIDPSEYAMRDTAAVKLELAARYVAAGGPNAPGFVQQLDQSNWTTIKRARQTLQEVIDGVDADALQAALRDPAARPVVVLSLQDPSVFDAMTMSACFTDPVLNRAAARAHFDPVWTFSDNRRAHGWDVRHFFASSGDVKPHQVSVCFERNGMTVKDLAGTDVTVSESLAIPPRQRASRKRVALQLVRTTLLMVLSAVALQKTALALLSNTNFVSVVLGVFSTGFLIDTLKSGVDAIRLRGAS